MYSSSRKCVLAGLVAMLVAGTITVASEPVQREPEKQAPASQVATDLYGDPLPAGAVARLGTVRLRRRSDHYLYGMAFLPDNNTLLTADGERAQFWDAKTGRLLREISVEPLSIRNFAIAPDAKHFAVAGLGPAERAEIRVLDTASGKTVQILPRPTFRDIEPARLAFSPDGKLLFSLGWSGICRVEEIASGKERRQREFPKDSVQGLVVSADGKSLVIASGPNTRKLFLWKWEDREPQLLKDAERVEGIGFSPDGRFLACVSSFPNRLHMLEIPSGRVVYQRAIGDKGRSSVSAPVFTPDGKTVLVSHQPASSGRWRTELVDAKSGASKEYVAGGRLLAVSPNSRFLASGDGQALRVVDLTTRQDLSGNEAGHTDAPSRILVSRFGCIVTAGGAHLYGYDNTVRIWDGGTGKQKRVIPLAGWVRDIALSGDGRLLAASCFDDTVRLIGAEDGREIYRLAGHGKVGSGRGAALAFAPDGASLLSWGDDSNLRQWDVKTGRALLEHRLRPGGVPEGDVMFRDIHRGMAAMLADTTTVVVDLAGHYHFFDVASGKEKQKLAHGNSSSSSLAISPNGKYLLATYWARSGQQTHTVLLRNLASDGEMNIVLPGTVAGPVAFSPDSRSFATSTHAPDEIRIFETATGQERRRIRGVPGRVWSLAFLHDGRRVASGVSDATVLIWDLTAPVEDAGPSPGQERGLQARWDDLASSDSKRAFTAIWALTGTPEKTIAFFQTHLKPAVPADPKVVTQLIRELGDNRFAVRKKANAELEKLGELAAHILEEAKKDSSLALEARQRLDKLLASLRGPVTSPEKLRGIRAVETLEYIGTPEARALLERLAQGAPAARVTEEARESLARLRNR